MLKLEPQVVLEKCVPTQEPVTCNTWVGVSFLKRDTDVKYYGCIYAQLLTHDIYCIYLFIANEIKMPPTNRQRWFYSFDLVPYFLNMYLTHYPE